MRWIVHRSLRVSDVDNELTHSMSRLKPIASKALKLSTQSVAANVGLTIQGEMRRLARRSTARPTSRSTTWESSGFVEFKGAQRAFAVTVTA